MISPNEIIRTNRNSIALTINEKGDLIVRAPFSMPVEKIYDFIKEKQKWIEKKQTFIKTTLNENKDITEYNSIFLLGKKYPIVMVKGLDKVILIKDHLAIPFTTSINVKKHNLKTFLCINIEKIIMPKINNFARKIGVSPTSIKVVNSKAKWGMCDSNHNIYFNYKLAMLSTEMIEYVIVHELCHIKHLNHSKEFWKQVEKFMPDYKSVVNMLKKSDFLIKLF